MKFNSHLNGKGFKKCIMQFSHVFKILEIINCILSVYNEGKDDCTLVTTPTVSYYSAISELVSIKSISAMAFDFPYPEKRKGMILFVVL